MSALMYQPYFYILGKHNVYPTFESSIMLNRMVLEIGNCLQARPPPPVSIRPEELRLQIPHIFNISIN